jgi:hypothetical protein
VVKETPKLLNVPDKRQVLIELSCASESCDPCTYPNCQRYVRENTKSKKPVVRRVRELSAEEFQKMTKMPRTKE